MCTKSNEEWTARQLSTGGRGLGPFDWSNSFFEIQRMRQDEDSIISKCDERKEILESLNLRKDELLKEIAGIKELHLTHNVFLKSKDVDQMVKKAEGKLSEVVLMEAERQRLSQEVAQLQQRRRELERQVLSYSVYNDFLQQVLKLSTFDEVRELVGHFESLLLFRDQHSQRDSSEQERVNQLRTELVTLQDQSHLMMAHRSNQLAHIQTELERARSEAFSWEQKWNHIEETAAKKTLLLGKIKLATLNLYEMTGSPLDSAGQSVDVNDTDAQLEKIQEFIQDHSDIVKRYTSAKEQEQ